MALPNQMFALVQKESGYARAPDASELTSLDPWLDARQTDVPQPRKGQVLVKIRLASINPSDTAFIRGQYGQPRVAGRAAGFEGVGDVVASGGGFLAGRLIGKRIAFVAASSGTWAEYALADAATCITLRKDVRDEDGAAMIVNPLTAYAMFDLVRREGAKAFVMTAGASQLCKLIAGLAKEQGYRAISIVRRDDQIGPLKSLGATHVLNSDAPDFRQTLRAILKEEKPRIFLDAVTGPLAANIFNDMGNGSRWVVYGRLDAAQTPIHEPGQMIFQSKRIEGFWLVTWLGNASILMKILATRAVQARFASGVWITDVNAIIPLREAHARVPALLAQANTGKIMLKP